MKATLLILSSLAVSFLLGYFADSLHPAVYRAMVTTWLFSCLWGGTHYSTVWLGRHMERYRECEVDCTAK